MGRISKRYNFNNRNGEKLAAILDLPETPPIFYGVFAPCFTCVKESHAATKISRALAERGVGMLRFDTTGFGASEGDPAATNFSTRVSDIVSACKSMAENFAPPRLLIGHSMSGTAGLSAVHQTPSIELLATVNSPADPQAIIHKFTRLGHLKDGEDEAELMVLGTRYAFKKGFVEDMRAADVAKDTARIPCRLAVFHTPNDDIVSFDNADTIIRRAGKKAELVRLPVTATHLFEKGEADALFVAEELISRLS